MTIDLKLTGLPGLQSKVKALEETPFAEPLMGEIGMFIMRNVKKRTLKGEDVNGLNFKPYNPMYAKSRAKDGYQISKVDLSRTGSMLSSMNYENDSDSVNIFFMNTMPPEGKTRNPAKAFFLQQDRDFFSLSSGDIKGIMLIVQVYYKKLMNSMK